MDKVNFFQMDEQEETNHHHQLCILCCDTHSGTPIAQADEGDQLIFKKFCKEVLISNGDNNGGGGGWESGKSLLKSLTRVAPNISICSVCLYLVKKATECQELAGEVERKVADLQKRILCEMKLLKRRMEWLFGDMKRIAEVVEAKDFETENGEGKEEEEETNEVVLRLREEILQVTHNLDYFNSNLSAKLLSSKFAERPKEKAIAKMAAATNVSKPEVVVDCITDYPIEVKVEVDSNEEVDDGEAAIPVPSRVSHSAYSWDQDPLDEDNYDSEDLSSDTEDNDDDEDYQSPGTSSKVKRPKLSSSVLSSDPSNLDVDMSGMSSFRKKVLTRVIAKWRRRLAKPNSKPGNIDPRLLYLMEYDKKTGHLVVGEINDLKINDEEETLSCSRCDYKSFDSQTGYKVSCEVKLFLHILGHHFNAFNCHFCSKNFLSWNHYLVHIQTHEKPEVVTCITCSKTLCSRQALRRHTRNHHSVVKKERNPNRVPCSTCGKFFLSKHDLERHEAKVHQLLPPNPKDEKPETFLCPTCGKEFNKFGWKSHRYAGCPALNLQDSNRLRCEICSREQANKVGGTSSKWYTFKDERALLRHQKTYHSKKLDYSFMCEYCSTRFKMKFDLNKHLKIKQSEEPIQCRYGCGEEFTMRCQLKQHEKGCDAHKK